MRHRYTSYLLLCFLGLALIQDGVVQADLQAVKVGNEGLQPVQGGNQNGGQVNQGNIVPLPVNNSIGGKEAGDEIGRSVSAAGDINGDGYTDVLIGAPKAGIFGEAYLLYGSPSGISNSLSLSTLNGTNGVRLLGAQKTGTSVSGAGDVNGDGRDDFLVVAGNASPAGRGAAGVTYLVYGSHAFGANGSFGLLLLNQSGGTEGVEIQGPGVLTGPAMAASGVGDVNHDGFDDIAVAIPWRNQVYVIFGDAGGVGLNGVLDLASFNAGHGFRIQNGPVESLLDLENLGGSISGAGDINADGYDDILIGASFGDPKNRQDAGGAYVVFGGPAIGASDLLDLSAPANVQKRLYIQGASANERAGTSVSGAGDVNRDGYDDVLVGSNHPKARLVYGKANPGNSLDLAGLNASRGVYFYEQWSDASNDPPAESTLTVAGAGDVNADGFADFLLGYGGADLPNKPDAGHVRLIYGGQSIGGNGGQLNLTTDLSAQKGKTHDGVQANAEFGRAVSGAGDTNGDGRTDYMVGAPKENYKPSLTIGLGRVDSGAVRMYSGSLVQGGQPGYKAFTRAALPQELTDPLNPDFLPPEPVGAIGDGSHRRPFSRTTVRFAGGLQGTTRVELHRSAVPSPDPDLTPAGVHWEVETTRSGFKRSQIAFEYTSSEISGLEEGKLGVYFTADTTLDGNTEWIPLAVARKPGKLIVTNNHDGVNPQANFNGYYAVFEGDFTYTLGEEIPPPAGVDYTKLAPTGPEVNFSEKVLWNTSTQPPRLYAVGAQAGVVITWKDSAANDLVVESTLIWPTNGDPVYQTHVAGSLPVHLLGNTYTSAYLTDDTSGMSFAGGPVPLAQFVAEGPRESLLAFVEGNAPTADPIAFLHVDTISWQEHADVPHDIGEEIYDANLHTALCGGPLVYHEFGRYAADHPSLTSHPEFGDINHPGYYDRASRTGPIIPINTDAITVVYYETHSATSTCWPYVPVEYHCDWPQNPETIVVASTQGSGPLALENPAVYRQPDPALPGYNANEEHGMILPIQGTPTKLIVSAKEIMVLEGHTTAVEVALLSAPTGDVTVTASSSKDGDPDLSVFETSLLFTLDPNSDDYWGNPKTFTFAAAEEEDVDDPNADDMVSGEAIFTIRAMGGLTAKQTIHVHEADADVSGLVVEVMACAVTEGATRDVALQLSAPPAGAVTVEVSPKNGDPDIDVVQGTETLTFSVLNWDVPQLVTFEALVDSDVGNGSRSFDVVATGGINVTMELIIDEADSNAPESAVFSLRDDLGEPSTSLPYTLVKYTDNGDARIKVYRVLREDQTYTFDYPLTAGLVVQPPYPITIISPNCAPNEAISGPYWEDHKGTFWAKAAGFTQNGDPAIEDVVMHFFYTVQPGFDFPPNVQVPALGTCIPLLDDNTETPIDVTYNISWPDDIPQLRFGETLLKPKFGLPNILNQCSVTVIYEQHTNGTPVGVKLIDPLTPRATALNELPSEIVTELEQGKKVLMDLPLALRQRVRYNPTALELEFGGVYDTSGVGDALLLLNVMTEVERDTLKDLSSDAAYKQAVDNLYQTSRHQLVGQDFVGAQEKALTAGFANVEGYVTLAMQDDCGALPVSLEIIHVTCPPYKGSIQVIYPDCPFEEKLTLKHSGDFAGEADSIKFRWAYKLAEGAENIDPPQGQDLAGTGWIHYSEEMGTADTTIGTQPGLLSLADTLWICSYEYPSGPCSGWSEWTQPQLAEGWIKRVLGGVNPYDQITSNFHQNMVNTVVDMLQQAGPRWEGNIALNCSAGNDFGLIEAYETILRRGMDLSINAGFDVEGANDQLINAARHLTELYMLFGNEAYADAQDPTIGFGTEDGQYGSEASSLHCFAGLTDSLLDEELALLRGRDDTLAPGVELGPIYNRVFWNFTGGIAGGEVAYALNYNVTDKNQDSQINEEDAKLLYPQGHGDAWGHYLSAIKGYYHLLVHPDFTWTADEEMVSVAGQGVAVNFRHERNFAKAAAARARTGTEIVNLTYRASYVENPEGQFQGYKDNDPERAWGFSEWGSRAAQAAYFDWAVGNAILPAEDLAAPAGSIQKVDRTTVLELREVASISHDIQAQVDNADTGLSPLGLAKNVVPFDIHPGEIDQGKTHFEQVYDRAVVGVNNAITVFNYANQQSQLLRRQQDSVQDFQRTVVEREAEFNNRLIEAFGYPYEEDIGPGGAYPTNYNGPDVYHWAYADASVLTPDSDIGPVEEIVVPFKELEVTAEGGIDLAPKAVKFHVSTQGFGFAKPPSWTQRRAPGEIQMAHSDILQARGRLVRAIQEYSTLIEQILDHADLLETQHQVHKSEIDILNQGKATQRNLSDDLKDALRNQLDAQRDARMAQLIANAGVEALPKIVGLANDATSAARAALLFGVQVYQEIKARDAADAEVEQLEHRNAKEEQQAIANIALTTNKQGLAVEQALLSLRDLVRRETSMRLEIFNLREGLQQFSGRYLAALARGQRILEDRLRFRRQTAAQTQEYRYKDMAFRIFRNDALGKYRAQFDLAAMFVYLAAKAYDFETNLLGSDFRSGEDFLTDIVRQRSIGKVGGGGQPLTGSGLTDAMARMNQNWQVLKNQLGFQNPQTETNRFSLRSEYFRILPGPGSSQLWRETLDRHRIDNILEIPEFRRYCRPFSPQLPNEPGIVIPMGTTVNFGVNFFGRPLGGGDSAYDSSQFATKIRSVGVWFSNYNNLVGGGMSQTPRVYLVPVGNDILRSPTGTLGETRSWSVLEQKLPLPFPIDSGSLANNHSWIPRVDTLSDVFTQVQRHSAFRAFHDSGTFEPSETFSSSRLVGRSVWNTRWVLIIPAGTLHSDRDEGLDRFIHGPEFGGERSGDGVADIKLFFQTYAYSGN